MLITVPRHPVVAPPGVDPTVQRLVDLVPDYGTGRRVHDLYANTAMASLPGNYSQLFGTGPSFRSVFYPDWQPDPLAAAVGSTGLDGGWWSGFATVLLCQAIADMGSDIRGQMLVGRIDADLRAMNDTLRARSARVYAEVLAATFAPLTDLLELLPDRAAAKGWFRDALVANVVNRQIWYQAGMWTSPDWEMFNQYAKYLALGASDAEVDDLITVLQDAGLPVPGAVDRAGWRQYAEQFRDKPYVDVDDVRARCSGPIGRTTYIGQASLPNGNCYEFTANGMPGSGYREPPGGGCCFTGATLVLTGDGTPAALSTVRRGDVVMTRDGTATVGYVATPARGDRSLFRLAGGGAVATGTHPFVNAAAGPDPAGGPPEPAVLAHDPRALLTAVPLLAAGGVGPLAAGAHVLGRGPGADAPVRDVVVTGVDPVGPGPDDDHLYDLHLAPVDGGRQEFWVGDGTTFHLACPEFPVLDSAGPAALAVVALMEGLVASNGPGGRGWPVDTEQVLRRVGVGVFTDALGQALSTTPSFGAPAPEGTVAARVDRLYAGLDGEPAGTSSLVAALFDGLLAAVGQWLPSLVATGWRSTTLLGGDVLAVTVFDLAVWPGTLDHHDADLRIDLTVHGHRGSETLTVWPQPAAGDTAFHRRVDRVVHADLTAAERPVSVTFELVTDGDRLPRAYAESPLGTEDHGLHAALLRDASAGVVGAVRFDARRIGRDAAGAELRDSGGWTDDAALAYAQALGRAMVAPVLQRIGAAAGPR